MNIELITKFIVESSLEDFTDFLENTNVETFSTIQDVLNNHITKENADNLTSIVESGDVEAAVEAQEILANKYVVESGINQLYDKLELVQEDKSDIALHYARLREEEKDEKMRAESNASTYRSKYTDAYNKNIMLEINNAKLELDNKKLLNQITIMQEKLDTSAKTIKNGKIAEGVAAGVAASVGILAVVKKIKVEKSKDYDTLMNEAQELVAKAKELREESKKGLLSEVVAGAKIKMLNARVNKISGRAQKLLAIKKNVVKESAEEDKIIDLMKQLDDVDDDFNSAKKKLVEGLYTKDEFQDISDNHESKVQELKDKIADLKSNR